MFDDKASRLKDKRFHVTPLCHTRGGQKVTYLCLSLYFRRPCTFANLAGYERCPLLP
jgi:hypothetical protein